MSSSRTPGSPSRPDSEFTRDYASSLRPSANTRIPIIPGSGFPPIRPLVRDDQQPQVPTGFPGTFRLPPPPPPVSSSRFQPGASVAPPPAPIPSAPIPAADFWADPENQWLADLPLETIREMGYNVESRFSRPAPPPVLPPVQDRWQEWEPLPQEEWEPLPHEDTWETSDAFVDELPSDALKQMGILYDDGVSARIPSPIRVAPRPSSPIRVTPRPSSPVRSPVRPSSPVRSPIRPLSPIRSEREQILEQQRLEYEQARRDDLNRRTQLENERIAAETAQFEAEERRRNAVLLQEQRNTADPRDLVTIQFRLPAGMISHRFLRTEPMGHLREQLRADTGHAGDFRITFGLGRFAKQITCDDETTLEECNLRGQMVLNVIPVTD